jgi:hypothetical protein
LQTANLTEAQLPGANLSFALLQGANLAQVIMPGVDLTGAQMQGVNLSKAQLQIADLTEAQLQGAVLVEARLDGAVLNGAQMKGADLLEASLWHVVADRPVDLGLALLESGGFRASRIDDVGTAALETELRRVIALISDKEARKRAKGRLQNMLSLTAPQPLFHFVASPSQPVLIVDPPGPELSAHPNWLLRLGTHDPLKSNRFSVYVNKLADFLCWRSGLH